MLIVVRVMVATAVVVVGLFGPMWLRHGHRRRYWRSQFTGAAFNNFVEFTAVKPDPTALRTIIDFNTQTLGHEQIWRAAGGAFHKGLLF